MEEEGVNGLKRTPSFYERASGVLNDYARSFKAMITPRVLADEIPADDASDSESESGSEELEASTPKGTEDEVESPTATSFAAKEMTEMAEDALVEDVTSAAPVSPGPAGSIDLSELVSATEGDANGAEVRLDGRCGPTVARQP